MKEHQQKFIGTWKLFEWSVEKPEGDKKYPFSGNVAGYLIYHPDGWMSANLMQKNRVNVSDDRLKISKISKMLKNENEIYIEWFTSCSTHYIFNKSKMEPEECF